MGFLKQDTPQIDFEEWSKGTRAEKIIPMARHWAEVGFGTPVALHLFYVVKIGLYILGAWLLALTTTGINGFTNVAHWYAEPIVFEKVVLYTMLFEVVGLGCGFGPLNNRFFPPMGSILYWMRFGTIRLPPWPERVPLTKGTKRTPIDVALYALVSHTLTFSPLTDLFWFGTLLPSVAVGVRRLHDIDRSGWWYLLMFVPLIGAIVLIVWWCKRGGKGYNRFGADRLPAEASLHGAGRSLHRADS